MLCHRSHNYGGGECLPRTPGSPIVSVTLRCNKMRGKSRRLPRYRQSHHADKAAILLRHGESSASLRFIPDGWLGRFSGGNSGFRNRGTRRRRWIGCRRSIDRRNQITLYYFDARRGVLVPCPPRRNLSRPKMTRYFFCCILRGSPSPKPCFSNRAVVQCAAGLVR